MRLCFLLFCLLGSNSVYPTGENTDLLAVTSSGVSTVAERLMSYCSYMKFTTALYGVTKEIQPLVFPTKEQQERDLLVKTRLNFLIMLQQCENCLAREVQNKYIGALDSAEVCESSIRQLILAGGKQEAEKLLFTYGQLRAIIKNET